MTEVISVRFRGGCKAYFFDPRGAAVDEGDEVVVETAQGAEFGTCVCGNHAVEDHAVIQPLRPMLRMATEEDRQVLARNRRREKEAFGICEKKIESHGLEMKLVSVECSFEGNKIIFFFTADGRVDFRELVKDLASVFHTRIELRQIGVRDEAKMLGGLGICGQPFCCKRFLDEFQPVSIKMAKTQNLSLNPTKISGSCGRLMCCLKYEQHAYEDAMTRMPKNDSFVQTPDGPGNISAVNLVRETVSVRLDDAPEAPKTYRVEEIIVLRNGKGSREGITVPERPARAAAEPAQDPFGLEQAYGGLSARPMLGTAPKRERSENPRGAGKSAEGGKGEKGGSHRSHRGGRGRRGGEGKESQRRESGRPNKQQEAARESKSAEGREKAVQAFRPVRFGSSMPIAGNAATPGPAPSQGKDAGQGGERKPHRRGRRPGRRGGRGSEGKKE